MSLTKAEIIIDQKDPPIKGPDGAEVRSFKVQFNPTEYSLNKGAQIAEIAIPGIDSPILQFIRGQNEKLTLDLFFDTTGEQGMGQSARPVTDYTHLVYQLVKIQEERHAPPRIEFHWGNHLKFKAIVESVQQKFSLFSPEGVPLRATVSVTFREYKTLEDQLKELNLLSPDHTKRWVVQQGDTLSRIAAAEYDDPALWRPIADKNNIANPRRLIPGMVLEIPPLDVFGQPLVG
jgi:nucleoid-associated protein YgaU